MNENEIIKIIRGIKVEKESLKYIYIYEKLRMPNKNFRGKHHQQITSHEREKSDLHNKIEETDTSIK